MKMVAAHQPQATGKQATAQDTNTFIIPVLVTIQLSQFKCHCAFDLVTPAYCYLLNERTEEGGRLNFT